MIREEMKTTPVEDKLSGRWDRLVLGTHLERCRASGRGDKLGTSGTPVAREDQQMEKPVQKGRTIVPSCSTGEKEEKARRRNEERRAVRGDRVQIRGGPRREQLCSSSVVRVWQSREQVSKTSAGRVEAEPAKLSVGTLALPPCDPRSSTVPPSTLLQILLRAR